MWTILVVIGDELAEDQRQVVFIQHDQVVQTLAAERLDHAFDDRVHVRLQLPAVAAMRNDFG